MYEPIVSNPAGSVTLVRLSQPSNKLTTSEVVAAVSAVLPICSTLDGMTMLVRPLFWKV